MYIHIVVITIICFFFLIGLPSDPAQVQQPILVCTAHIHWDPEFCDVKLIQTMMLSNELRSILDQASQSFRPGHKPDSSNVQLLLCGDFNSLPDSGKIHIHIFNLNICVRDFSIRLIKIALITTN